MYYPIHLDLKAVNIIIIGGGLIAFRKCQFLVEIGKHVTVVAKDFSPQFSTISDHVTLIKDAYNPSYIEKSFLVIAATDDRQLNAEIGAYCKAMQKLVNVASDQAQSNFIIPGQIKRGDLLLSVSTSGKNPTFTKTIKEELKQMYGPEYEEKMNEFERIKKKGDESGCK